MISNKVIENVITSKNVGLLIFDCDGTLMETLGLHYLAWSEAFQQIGYDFIKKDEFISKYAGISGGEMVASVISKLGYSIDKNIVLINKKKIFMEKYIFQVTPIEKTLSIVKKYHGNIKMVVASGGAKDAVIKMLVSNNILELFNHVIAIEDVSAGKPSPEIFLKAAASQNISPINCLVFEDHVAGFDAAISAGMTYIDANKLL